MYNRYVPQQDGSHRRNRMEEPPQHTSQHRNSPLPDSPEPPCNLPPKSTQPPPAGHIGGFLRQLLPKDFDTGDLIVVLLLLLMAGDKPEDRKTALLTLALYCFL